MTEANESAAARVLRLSRAEELRTSDAVAVNEAWKPSGKVTSDELDVEHGASAYNKRFFYEKSFFASAISHKL